MPILKNARHEKFAQGLFSGMSATEAYKRAGFSEEGAGQSGHKLLKNAEIQSRVSELFTASADEAILSKQTVARILSKIIETNVSDFVRLDADGGHIDINPETAHAHAIRSVKSRTIDHGSQRMVIVDLQLVDKIGAIRELCKTMGYYYAPTHSHVAGNTPLAAHKDYDLAAVLEQRLADLKKRLVAGDPYSISFGVPAKQLEAAPVKHGQ